MSEIIYLTEDELYERWRGSVALGTMRNHRSMGIGPPYVKIGKAVLYPKDELQTWERDHLILNRGNVAAE